jgi:hypothetical protein
MGQVKAFENWYSSWNRSRSLLHPERETDNFACYEFKAAISTLGDFRVTKWFRDIGPILERN